MGGSGASQVSWQENQRYFDKLFTRLDVNHDGFISEEEFKAIDNDPVFKAMPLQKLQVSFTMFETAMMTISSHTRNLSIWATVYSPCSTGIWTA